MYNLNVNVNATPAQAAGLLSVAAAGAEVTPRTPEIVNSLIAMTNPFDGFNGSGGGGGGGGGGGAGSACASGTCPGVVQRCRDRNDSSSSGEPSPPSIQHTCSQLIKEGLKLTLQTKRRANGCLDDGKKRSKKEDGSADDEEEDESSNSKSITGLTPEDEERRRRRRERNKIAATKCRLKKREKTVILVQESETLETQNHVLKSQIQELETQRRRLVDMLNLHGPTCLKQPPPADTTYQQYAEPMVPLPSYQENFVPNLNQVANHINPQNQNDCTIVSDFGPVKVEGFNSVTQDFYRQGSPYMTTSATTTSNSDASCTV